MPNTAWDNRIVEYDPAVPLSTAELERMIQQAATALAFLAWVQTQYPDLWARWQAGPSADELPDG